MAVSFVALLTNCGVLPNRCCVIPNGTLIGASLSEPLLDELAGAFLWYIYIYLYPWAVHLVPRGPPVNAQRANVRPAE